MSFLFQYQDKEVRITTEDGSVFTGIAEAFSSGYGLHELDREEEGISGTEEETDESAFMREYRNGF